MSSDPSKYSSLLSSHLITVSVVGAASFAFVFYKYKSQILKTINSKLKLGDPLKYQKIQIINTHEDCQRAVENIKKICSTNKVLGFDCEWITKNGSRHPVALLQLASHDGQCTLIRLSKIQHVPKELKSILEDSSILKVGVAAIDDARYLFNDYDLKVKGIVDLRHLAILASEKPEGLAALAANHLNVEMDKHWRIRCSDWEADELSDRQVKYAADDAHVAVELFKVFILKILRQNHNIGYFANYEKFWEQIEAICKNVLNIKYVQKQLNPNKLNNLNSKTVDFENIISKQQKENFLHPNKSQRRSYSSTIKNEQVYENCYMKTTDGETLCTCDRKKAEWYVEKEIADVICNDPFTIQLRFEPAGRSVGEVGRFYQMPRNKSCVVCGTTHSYVKKNVIPKEYRKLFPAVMKDHSCHDVLLLCMDCHQLSNMRDQTMRTHLAKVCNAPLASNDQPKVYEDPVIKKVRSAARALLLSSTKHEIPATRKLELEDVVRNFFPAAEEITEELLLSACDLYYRVENDLYESHGKIVVDYFTESSGGLLELEKMWRKHFLSSMEPKYMPEFWSIDHTKSRLEIRASEGRVDKKDLEIAGLIIDDSPIESRQ